MGKTTRAVSPRRLNVTPELLADIRHRYEHTPESFSTMAADLGCSIETVRNIAKREGWVHYQPPPRDLSPAAKLLARAEKLAAEPPPKRGRSPSEARRVGVEASAAFPLEETPTPTLPLSGGGSGEARAGEGTAAAPQVADTAERLHRELQSLLAEVAAARQHMKREGYGKHELREAARTIADLTASLRALQSLQCRVPQTGAEPDYDDMPADLDEFRRELARRIRIFVEGRRARSGAGAASTDDAAAASS